MKLQSNLMCSPIPHNLWQLQGIKIDLLILMNILFQESESPERHYSYVWKNIIEKTEASKMFLVGHSYGGYLIVDYVSLC